MPRKVTPHSSHGVQPDQQPPRYGLRKRTAHQRKSDGNNLEDAGHQTFAKRAKRASPSTRAQSSSSRGPVKKGKRVSTGQGWAPKDKDKEWLAEAILKENDAQYLIEYAPVYEGAQHEISWQPKRNANAALVAWWEERKTNDALENSKAERDNVPALTTKENEVSHRHDLVDYGGRPRKSSPDIRSLVQYDAESYLSQRPADPVDKGTSGGFEETPEDTPRDATSPIIPDVLDNLVPERNVPAARMYEPVASNNRGAASAHPCVEVGGILSAAEEDNHRCDDTQFRADMATEIGSGRSQPKSSTIAPSSVQHFQSSARVQHLRMPDEKNSVNVRIADDSRGLDSAHVDAATAYVSRSRKDCTYVQDVYNAPLDSHSQAKALERIQDGNVAKRDGHGRPSPRPGTSISTILSQEPPTLSNINRDNEIATSVGRESGQALPRTLDHVKVSNNRDPGVSGALPGTLPSARERLRRLLLGSERRQFRKSGSRFPPSP